MLSTSLQMKANKRMVQMRDKRLGVRTECSMGVSDSFGSRASSLVAYSMPRQGLTFQRRGPPKDHNVDLSYLDQCLRYDEAGSLFWRERPLEHFLSSRHCLWWNRRYAGMKIITRNSDGYLSLRLHKKHWFAHRIIWMLHNRESIPPHLVIDHIDGVRNNNTPNNLRLVTYKENRIGARVRKRDYCMRGHLFTMENSAPSGNGKRKCRLCKNMNAVALRKTKAMDRPIASKYRNVPTTVDGIRFQSKREARRWRELKLLERAGKISDLRRQVRYELVPKQDGERAVTYLSDFNYREGGKEICEDCKGMRTPAYVIKRKLMLWLHKIKVRET